MPHHVADEDPSFGFGQGPDIEKVTTDGARWEVAMAKSEGAPIGRNVVRKGGILLRNDGLLRRSVISSTVPS